MKIWKVPKYFSFNCGPKWSAAIHYEGYGIGIRHEYSHIRIMLIFWHMIIDLEGDDPPFKPILPQLIPAVDIRWAEGNTWNITARNGNKNYCWLLFGLVEQEGVKAWQFAVWRLYVAFEWETDA